MIKYCQECGAPTHKVIPEGDHAKRDVCTACGFVHYQNPKIITGAIPMHGDKVLLCKRNIQPRLGYWTLPAGFMENAESTEQGAARETFEESEAKLKNMAMYTVIDIPHINQLYVFYRAELDGDHFCVTPESSAVQLFDEADIPWDEIAFPVVKTTLKRFFEERKAGGHFAIFHHTVNTDRLIIR